MPERLSESAQVEASLAYYHRLNTQAPDIQRRDFNDASAAYEKNQDDPTRLRLALALMVPGTSWRDDNRAAQLLGAIELAPPDHASVRRDFVQFLERMIQLRRDEQRRCEQRTEALREERRKTEALQQKLEGSREECKKAEVLQQKLDELRDIDRDMRKRSSRRSAP